MDGLEEGEVEGETLLMVESDSVDLSQDQSGDSVVSDVDQDQGPDQDPDQDQDLDQEMGFCCERCHKWITTAHLRGDAPSFLKGDNFFKFICSECSDDERESFERMRLTWQQVVMLAMYNLSLEGSGRQGYFRWKEDICAFIGRHWTFLLGTRKRTSTWWSTVAGCLSVGSPAFFRSGAQEFGEPGWWKLVHNRPPTLRPEADKSAPKSKGVRPCADPTITVEGLRRRGGSTPVEKAMQLKEKRSRTQEAKDIRRAQRGHAPTTQRDHAPKAPKPAPKAPKPPSKRGALDKPELMDLSSISSSDRTPLTSPSPSPSLLSEADLIPDAMPPQALFHDDEEPEPESVIDPGMEYVPPSSALIGRKKARPPVSAPIKREAESEDEDTPPCANDANDTNERCRQTAPSELATPGGGASGGARCLPIGPYEERLLLRRLEACPLALAVTASAKRLRRKLLVRQEKRSRGLPLLDVDRAASTALSLVGGVYSAQVGGVYSTHVGGATHRATNGDAQILDRFQSTGCSRHRQTLSSVSFFHRVMGSDSAHNQSIRSPYTARLLKPYIRRDYESRPLKLQLLSEVRAFGHRKDPDWIPEPDSPIDYCYVRPSHIPTLNALCHDAFWPGVDLSESLQYPDFTVVALYKKVVVGFGVMVPDVKYNQAYISFLLVHPEWRRAGIGTFMIYHLIQTCMGKDVTLHVSASNPAMLLYQKFGFRAEEYILDFYHKYFPLDSRECRHAFLLRLRR
ncbi:cysteine-rich protein 2-binding protein [Periophthalmus magnuspinnatus]|uniref:cysteine-rich protein 2-binding protein n=1 Tax=Periophthalmus magnuspinnatus TaxID=409849 RepID=UPI00243669A1|nr:cysteine-rich protein 2-binding protein [Periophthalmus magnuspinnatus]